MAIVFINLNARKLVYLYIICTVIVYGFMLHLYLQCDVVQVKIVPFNNVKQIVEENDINTTVPHLGMNEFNGILMEHVNLNYSGNIFITVKTTHKLYVDRLLPLLLTWLQTVDKNSVRC